MRTGTFIATALALSLGLSSGGYALAAKPAPVAPVAGATAAAKPSKMSGLGNGMSALSNIMSLGHPSLRLANRAGQALHDGKPGKAKVLKKLGFVAAIVERTAIPIGLTVAGAAGMGGVDSTPEIVQLWAINGALVGGSAALRITDRDAQGQPELKPNGKPKKTSGLSRMKEQFADEVAIGQHILPRAKEIQTAWNKANPGRPMSKDTSISMSYSEYVDSKQAAAKIGVTE